MAVYGRDYYGRAKYGGRQRFELAVDPLVAEPLGFDGVHITWGEPGGDWSGFRLVRNRRGFPISEEDGEIVMETPFGYSGSTGGEFLDTNRDGGWWYYAIFLWDNGAQVWERAAAVDVLMPYDYGNIDRVWDLIPDYYKTVYDDTAGYNQQRYRTNPAIYLQNRDSGPNLQFAKFLHIFGWAMDVLRTQADQVLDGYDVDRVHVNRLALLAQQFGSEIEESAPAYVNRNLVRNLGWLHRKRGTIEGIREQVSLVTGWDVNVTIGPNLMLSEDQANFVNPYPQWWDSSVRYVAGDRVVHGRYMFEAKKKAYGTGQAPPLTKESNEWWDHDRFVEPLEDYSVARTDTGDISTWQLEGPGGWQPGGTFIGTGSMDPEDGTLFFNNSLAFRNYTDVNNATFTLRSIPRRQTNMTSWDKRLVIESGVPVPRPRRQWQEGRRYRSGEMVMYEGSPYEALGDTDESPESALSWRRLGHDDRVRLCLSWFSKGPHQGTVNTGGRLNRAVITEFDENGDFINDVICTPGVFTGHFYDAFNTPGQVEGGREAAVGGAWGLGGVVSWETSRDDTSGYAIPPTTGRSFQLAPPLSADANLAVTYRRVPVTGRLLGLVFRWTDTNNFWIATQTGVYRIQAGTRTLMLSYPSFVDGDRMRVELDGSSIRVYKVGSGQVGSTVTSAFNATATRHGIEVEA